MQARTAAAQRQRDLARLRRVRDRIDREYAQPLDVEAPCVAKQVTRPIRDREVRALQPQLA